MGMGEWRVGVALSLTATVLALRWRQQRYLMAFYFLPRLLETVVVVFVVAGGHLAHVKS